MNIFDIIKKMGELFSVIKTSVQQVPFMKFAFALTVIGVCVGMIGSVEIGNFYPVAGCVIIALVFMVLLYLLASFTTSADPVVKICGRILISVVAGAFCASIILLLLSVFFNIPKPIELYISSFTHQP
jgi:hypothetical protein